MAQHYTPIWDDWAEVTRELNAQEKGRLIDAIVEYDNGGDWQDQIKGNERYVFPGYKARIDRWKETCDNRAKPKNSDSEQNEQNEQNETKKTKPDKNNKTHKDKDKVKDKDKDLLKDTLLKESTEKRERFSPPSIEDVTAYCKERGNRVSAQTFIDFYTAKGWRVGNNPMKDWRAAIRTWEQRDRIVENPKRVRGAGEYTGEDDF